MWITALRCLIMYFVLILAVRIMGKRQISELRAGDLVVTVMVSEIASIPIQDTETPIYFAFFAIGIVVVLELLMSFLCLKSPLVQDVFSGKSALIIDNGIIDQKKLKLLRLTLDDLCEEFRISGVFDLSRVQYAFVESNGKVSYLLYPQFRAKKAGVEGYERENDGLMRVVVADGKIVKEAVKGLKIEKSTVEKLLETVGCLDISDCFLLSYSSVSGKYYYVKKGSSMTQFGKIEV